MFKKFVEYQKILWGYYRGDGYPKRGAWGRLATVLSLHKKNAWLSPWMVRRPTEDNPTLTDTNYGCKQALSAEVKVGCEAKASN